MSRRAQAPKRLVLPDPKYGNEMLAKFINMVMKAGKKSVAERIVYGALDRISERSGETDERAVELLGQALDNVKPAVEVKSRRVGPVAGSCGAGVHPPGPPLLAPPPGRLLSRQIVLKHG